jgi:CRP/FNR family transcriptional activator FtrB
MKDCLNILGEVVHTLQTERGSSLLFLINKNSTSEKTLLIQTNKTDNEYQQLINYIEKSRNYKGLDTIQKKMLVRICHNLNSLSVEREKIKIKHDIVFSKVINYYSNEIISPVIYLMINLSLSLQGEHPSVINAYCFLLQWKEKIGLERVIAISGFINYDFDNKVFLERIDFLLGEQNIFKQYFLSLASQKQKKLVDSMYALSTIKKLSYIHKELVSNKNTDTLRNMTADDWFEIVSEKINFLHSIEKELVSELGNYSKTSQKASYLFKEKYKTIYNLFLFSNMEKESIDEIMQQGKVYEMPKNRALFFENNIPTYLHIIIKGSIKIYKNSEDGKEIILQLLSDGESVLESSILLNKKFYASAQTVSKTFLFSLPITVITKLIKNNNAFSVNLLTMLSKQLQNSNQELDMLKSKSTNQRIGYFLLNLLNKKEFDSNKINLPYNKSLIASYLGMSREGFSRSIHILNTRGFRVEKDRVTIPNKYSLCEYCDMNIANYCVLNRTEQCKNFVSF